MDQNNTQDSQVNVLDVAKTQKGILLCLVVLILELVLIAFLRSLLTQPLISILIAIINWAIGIASLYFTIKLILSLRQQLAALWIIGIFIPLLNLILLLILISKSTKVIRKQGFRVGLVGANIKEIKTKLSQPTATVATPIVS